MSQASKQAREVAKPPSSSESPSSAGRWLSSVVIAAIFTSIGAIAVAIINNLHTNQGETKFVLTGHVSSTADGANIGGANLTLTIPGHGVLNKISNAQGSFVFSELPTLEGKLSVSASGYANAWLDITHLYATQTMEIQLTPIATTPPPSQKSTSNPTTARAEANTGWWYETGQIGGKPDYAEAMKHYLKAVEEGDIIANWNIGRLYEHGLGVTQDMETARLWYKKAADQGDTRAQEYINNLGRNP